MQQQLKKRRQIAYKLNKWDDVNLPFFIVNNDIPQQVIKFFKTQSELVYPAKSYFVAIVYAKCLEKYFAQDFYNSLDDPELLVDDKYFKPYSEALETYNNILDGIGTNILEYPSTEKTVNYFKKEFLVDDKLWSLQ